MRRVYVQYTNRVGPRVSLTTQEMRVLSQADWFDVLGVRKLRYHIRKNMLFDHTADVPIVLEVVRTHADNRLQSVPERLNNLQLVGITWKRCSDATVNANGFYNVQKDHVVPVTNLASHLDANDHRSQLIVFAPQVAGIKPFPVQDFKGVNILQVVMQLPQLRDWLWGQPAQDTAALVPNCGKMCAWPQPAAEDLALWLKTHPEAAELWSGGQPAAVGPLSTAAHVIRQQPTLHSLVQSYDAHRGQLSDMEARVLRRATEIELQRRELRDLMEDEKQKLARAQSSAKQYRVLLMCDKQVCSKFIDLDWEADAPVRDFTRQVRMQLNSPEFMKHWQPIPMPDVKDSHLNNSLNRALHIVNAAREEPLKLKWPLQHDIFKTWVALQTKYGPSDDFVSAPEYGLALSKEQRAMREFVWQNHEQLEQIEAQCTQYPAALHECRRLRPVLKALRQFKGDRERLLDAVRKSPDMRLLLDDILTHVNLNPTFS
jgi:hypothetical protein